MKNQVVLLVFALVSTAFAAGKLPWAFNCTAEISNTNWQCGSDFFVPELAAPILVSRPNNSLFTDYGLKICIQSRLGLANPARWSSETCTYYEEIAPVESAPISVPVQAPTAEVPVAAPVEAPKAVPIAAPVKAPVAAPVEAPKAVPIAAPVKAPVAAPVEAPKAVPVAAPVKSAMMFAGKPSHYLTKGNYVIGVAFVKPPTGNYSYSLPNFLITSSVCPEKRGDFECKTTPQIFSFLNGNTSFGLGASTADSFSASINNVFYGSVTVKSNPLVGIHLRRAGYAFTTFGEFAYNGANSNNGELTLNNPAPGDYIIATVLAGNSSQFEFELLSSAVACNASANVAGPNCTTSVVELSNAAGQLYDGTARSSMSYYKLKVNLFNKTRLSFSVASKSSAPTPRVYVRWGNLPDEKTYDFMGCSTEYCAVNQVDLEVLSGSAGDWYIGVVAAPNSTDSTDFGIWHGSICPNNCGGDHGTCNTSGEKMGTCSCAEGFTALDCSQVVSTGLSPEMIVLIVMGALVVLSAVIGFIAWAYMRRKRGYDEIQ